MSTASAEFRLGRMYTRDDIHDHLGGEKVSYLPSSNRRIVCGCFGLDLNPDAPHVVLPGFGPRIESRARQLASRVEPLPVFLKRGTNRWEYQGMWRVTDASRNPAVIRRFRGSRRDVSWVIQLEPVS